MARLYNLYYSIWYIQVWSILYTCIYIQYFFHISTIFVHPLKPHAVKKKKKTAIQNVWTPSSVRNTPTTLTKAHQKELFKNHSVKLVDVDWDTPPKMKGYKEHRVREAQIKSHGIPSFVYFFSERLLLKIFLLQRLLLFFWVAGLSSWKWLCDVYLKPDVCSASRAQNTPLHHTTCNSGDDQLFSSSFSLVNDYSSQTIKIYILYTSQHLPVRVLFEP